MTHRILTNAERGAEFACVHNQDSNVFINDEEFERLILKKTKANEPYCWDLLDETGKHVVENIVEDEDKGPSKEWGPFGLYRHPTSIDIEKGSSGKTVWLSPVVNM